ncbi:MAG: enoyl-CoA hydratase/isomerase family protein [Dehalococcoidia bacterium]
MADYRGYQFIQAEMDDDVLVLTLNRPERLNAVHGPLHTELSKIFRDVNRDTDAKAVVLTGAGRAFCAGGDVQGMSERGAGSISTERYAEVRGEAVEIVNSILDLEKPLIAKVNGAAVGLGATIALLCDVVVASDKARIGDRHVNVGLVAGDGGALIWPLLVGVNKAKELLMTGDLIQGDELRQLGIANHVVPQDELDSFTMDLAKRLAGMAPYACRASKVAINKIVKQRAELVMDIGLSWEWLSMQKADHHEAATAWVEKREPVFTGR